MYREENPTITQIVGAIGLIIGVAAFQSNRHKNILLIKTLSDCLFGIQFLLLGAYTGLLMNCIGIIRNITLTKTTRTKKSSIVSIIIFAILITLAGLFSWNGPLSLLAMWGKFCTTVSFGIKNTKYLRFLTVPSCVSWIIYDFCTHSAAGVIYELLSLASILVATIRYDYHHTTSISP